MATGSALREIADALDGELTWSPGIGWLRWDGKVWGEVPESTAVTAASKRTDELGHRPSTARELRATLEIRAGDLDAHPDLLNVQNGVVNLRTGELRPYSRARLMTKVASVNYDSEAQSDTWDEMLAAIPASERERLQIRIAGAVADGPLDDVTLIHGPGTSGKSTLMQAVRSALGTYALATDGNLRGSLELLDLRGTRLLFMDDAKPGDMDRVKRLTAVDEFCGRRMHRDAVTFKRSHSVLLATNLQPSDLATDEGTRQQLHPVELTALEERNPLLNTLVREPETLRAVLRWIVDGAVRGYAAT